MNSKVYPVAGDSSLSLSEGSSRRSVAAGASVQRDHSVVDRAQ
jgi:hypothetical protein